MTPLTDRGAILWALNRLQEFGALTSSEEGKDLSRRLVSIADAMADPERPPGVGVPQAPIAVGWFELRDGEWRQCPKGTVGALQLYELPAGVPILHEGQQHE